MLGAQTTLLDAFKSANEVLQGAVQGIAELITRPGLINVDFADVRTVMSRDRHGDDGLGLLPAARIARAKQPKRRCPQPLLEDINLAGAHGILVNVTAGLDLSIGEFEEVGNVVKQFASDDATVVVGTVIDPDMANMIRVTVVATGLGRPVVQTQARPVYVREATAAAAARAPAATEPAMRVVSRRPLTAADYAALDKPAVQRQRAVGDGLRPEAEPEDVLDIPAFLRRQAD